MTRLRCLYCYDTACGHDQVTAAALRQRRLARLRAAPHHGPYQPRPDARSSCRPCAAGLGCNRDCLHHCHQGPL